VLADDHRRLRWHPSEARLLLRAEQRLERVAHVNDAGAARVSADPRHRPVERKVDLERPDP
jgi:hypothetical protein